MKYFNIIADIIMIGLSIFGIGLFLFVIIRDKFFPMKDENNSNQSRDGRERLEDLW